MSLLTAMTAVLLSFNAPAPAGQNPCGDAKARQLIAFAAYSDKNAYRVNVEPNVDLEIFRDGDGPSSFVTRRLTRQSILWRETSSMVTYR